MSTRWTLGVSLKAFAVGWKMFSEEELNLLNSFLSDGPNPQSAPTPPTLLDSTTPIGLLCKSTPDFTAVERLKIRSRFLSIPNLPPGGNAPLDVNRSELLKESIMEVVSKQIGLGREMNVRNRVGNLLASSAACSSDAVLGDLVTRSWKVFDLITSQESLIPKVIAYIQMNSGYRTSYETRQTQGGDDEVPAEFVRFKFKLPDELLVDQMYERFNSRTLLTLSCPGDDGNGQILPATFAANVFNPNDIELLSALASNLEDRRTKVQDNKFFIFPDPNNADASMNVFYTTSMSAQLRQNILFYTQLYERISLYETWGEIIVELFKNLVDLREERDMPFEYFIDELANFVLFDVENIDGIEFANFIGRALPESKRGLSEMRTRVTLDIYDAVEDSADTWEFAGTRLKHYKYRDIGGGGAGPPTSERGTSGGTSGGTPDGINYEEVRRQFMAVKITERLAHARLHLVNPRNLYIRILYYLFGGDMFVEPLNPAMVFGSTAIEFMAMDPKWLMDEPMMNLRAIDGILNLVGSKDLGIKDVQDDKDEEDLAITKSNANIVDQTNSKLQLMFSYLTSYGTKHPQFDLVQRSKNQLEYIKAWDLARARTLQYQQSWLAEKEARRTRFNRNWRIIQYLSKRDDIPWLFYNALSGVMEDPASGNTYGPPDGAVFKSEIERRQRGIPSLYWWAPENPPAGQIQRVREMPNVDKRRLEGGDGFLIAPTILDKPVGPLEDDRIDVEYKQWFESVKAFQEIANSVSPSELARMYAYSRPYVDAPATDSMTADEVHDFMRQWWDKDTQLKKTITIGQLKIKSFVTSGQQAAQVTYANQWLELQKCIQLTKDETDEYELRKSRIGNGQFDKNYQENLQESKEKWNTLRAQRGTSRLGRPSWRQNSNVRFDLLDQKDDSFVSGIINAITTDATDADALIEEAEMADVQEAEGDTRFDSKRRMLQVLQNSNPFYVAVAMDALHTNDELFQDWTLEHNDQRFQTPMNFEEYRRRRLTWIDRYGATTTSSLYSTARRDGTDGGFFDVGTYSEDSLCNRMGKLHVKF